MKKLITIACLTLALAMPVLAQGPVYLPLITKNNPCVEDSIVGNWFVIVAEATTNMVLNPSAETTGNFASAGAGVMSRTSAYNRYGLYSFQIVTVANDAGGDLTLSTLTNATHYVTLRVRGTLPPAWDWSLDGATYTAPTLLEQLDSNWALYGLQFPAAQANGSTTLEIRQDGLGAGNFYIDGVQVEAKSYWTTYCDGDQEGCSWSGAEHASYSTRSAATTAGGRQRDLEDDYDFDISGMIGLGTAPQTVTVDEYAILPGGEINFVKIHPRSFTLTGVVRGTSYSDLHTKLNTLESVLNPNTCPIVLRYTGSTVHKEIAACYEGGMEGNITAEGPCYWQRMGIRFVAEDPYFYSYGGSGPGTGGGGGAGTAIPLIVNDQATFRTIAARLKSTGQWDPMGPPNAAGTYVTTDAFEEDGTYIYIGGGFLNWDNDPAADRITRYNKATGAYSNMGISNGSVDDFALKADGNLYTVGAFTTIGGVAANRVAEWNGAAWSALGAGTDGIIYTCAIGLDGTLYVGGIFANAGGNPAVRVASWDGAAWSALGAGCDADVKDMAIGLDGTLYAGGQFVNAGGVACNYIAQWDGSAWSALAGGANNDVYGLAVGPDGTLYAGGAFTTIGGISANYIAKWNGTAWSPLGDGTDNNVFGITVGPDGIVYINGLFTSAGGITLADRMAKWNGASWAHLDIDMPGAGSLGTMWASQRQDPVVPSNYDLYIGGQDSGTGYFAGKTTVTNSGTNPAYPVIIFERSGGTSATIESVRNESTGKWLYFDYALLDGEKLTIDLRPTKQSITSSLFGSRPDAILANSDMGTFTLQTGDNTITAFVNLQGGAACTGWMKWGEIYTGL